MTYSEDVTRYIEEHIGLIENHEWKEFFADAPGGCGEALYEAGIEFMEGLGYVPEYAFSSCNRLTNITIPNSVTNIDGSAFARCTRLTSVTIPNSVISIGTYAFYGCNHINIDFKGTKAEWTELVPDTSLIFNAAYICTCLDGVIQG